MFALFNRVKQILSVMIGILRSHLTGFGVGEGFAALIGLTVNLNIMEGTIRLGEFVSVARVPIHVTIREGRATIGEKMHHLVGRLLMSRKIVPEHGCILEIGLRISFLSVDKLALVSMQKLRSIC